MKFRIARHTSNLQPLIKFYTEILGLEVLGEFKAHDDYDGIFLGVPGKDWHLEFTVSNEVPDHHPDEDDLLVFYPGSSDEHAQIISRFAEHNIPEVDAKNPYWKLNGKTYLDPDGYRVVIALPN